MTIFIAADHGGFDLKERLINWLNSESFSVADLGAYVLDGDDDYPDYAFKLADKLVEEISSGGQALGILLCRSGVGMSIAANKVKGCYAALCFSVEQARKAREDDHANILVLDSDYLPIENHIEIAKTFINSTEEGGRHDRRVDKVKKYEETNL
jgi:ribose 5-phosphate isomerase B